MSTKLKMKFVDDVIGVVLTRQMEPEVAAKIFAKTIQVRRKFGPM